ncbi:hypothetical protein MPDQ_003776 [Monascus purpureus]|uniref:Uncharacterized protein n=1 Tax=Monascus purpureus TaxID=5098 RepID=A0A507QI81_MONPU|nr:hypothetical protein MPDQ_003776 [Monascus purpureus]BDD56762.1 hypothetical protein MAP00_002187 [Monascus purpureus]
MMFKSFGLAAAFAATLSSAFPAIVPRNASGSDITGGVQIVNNLNVPVYAWSVADTVGSMQTLAANGGSYSENWRVNSNGGGVSIKLATTPSQDDVLQFEYTEAGSTIFWDLSCINMGTNSEFTKFGFAVTANNPQCPSAVCKAGDTACADAYLQPDDNEATHGCPINTGFTLAIGQ